ncbi:hypothetical protein diail_3372 [Diaporthe ilicicola]|nr:hypothetical protein diail_3372 [Diaporthe ilicicola]
MVISVYVSETAPPSVRGRLMGIFEIALQGGGMLGFWISYACDRTIEVDRQAQWIIQSIVAYLQEPAPDVDVHICVSLGYAPMLGDDMCTNDLFYTKPEEKPNALEPFVDMQPQIDQMKTFRVDSLKGFTDEGTAAALANRVMKMSTTVKADTSIIDYAVETCNKSLGELEEVVENVLFSLTFESLPITMLEQSAARGGNAFGLQFEDGPLVVLPL